MRPPAVTGRATRRASVPGTSTVPEPRAASAAAARWVAAGARGCSRAVPPANTHTGVSRVASSGDSGTCSRPPCTDRVLSRAAARVRATSRACASRRRSSSTLNTTTSTARATPRLATVARKSLPRRVRGRIEVMTAADSRRRARSRSRRAPAARPACGGAGRRSRRGCSRARMAPCGQPARDERRAGAPPRRGRAASAPAGGTRSGSASTLAAAGRGGVRRRVEAQAVVRDARVGARRAAAGHAAGPRARRARTAS